MDGGLIFLIVSSSSEQYLLWFQLAFVKERDSSRHMLSTPVFDEVTNVILKLPSMTDHSR